MAIWHIGDGSQKAGRSIGINNYYQRQTSPRQSLASFRLRAARYGGQVGGRHDSEPFASRFPMDC